MCKSNALDYLVYKIFKFVNVYDRMIIKNIIVDTPTNDINKLKMNISKIYNIILKYCKTNNKTRDEHRQDFITNKIINFLNLLSPEAVNKNLSVADIGGGNGNVLSLINNTLGGCKNNFYCIETQSDWIEKYYYSNNNINYIYWNNNTIDIQDESCNIVMCMVSLHHMNEKTINNTLKEIKRILKIGGFILVKEHDCNNLKTQELINWEHYLYHIMDCVYENIIVNPEDYLDKTIHNFNSKEFWCVMFQKNGFKFITRKNRFLDDMYIENDKKNPTNLYWDIYSK